MRSNRAIAAQPAVAADRCAREIVAILTDCAARAAAERQPVMRQDHELVQGEDDDYE